MSRPLWTVPDVEAAKSAAKAELDAAEGAGEGRRVRLETALDRLRQLADDGVEADRLRRYVFVISALVAHERGGGLKPSQVTQLADLARTILAAAGIPTERSRLSFLHGELRLILSQIARRAGRHWDALWQQQLGFFVAAAGGMVGEDFREHALALRLLRLGHARIAAFHYARVEAIGSTAALRDKGRLGRMVALRLTGEAAAAQQHADAALQTVTDARTAREISWQSLCAGATRTGDLAPLIAAVRRDSTHADPEYALETLVWSRAVPARQWQARLTAAAPTMKALRAMSRTNPWGRALASLEDCFDTKTPLLLRIERLGAALAERHLFLSVDKELLMLAAACRWLARVKALSFAAVALGEYEALSLKLSDGRIRDVLGIASDLLTRPWYRTGTESVDAVDLDSAS